MLFIFIQSAMPGDMSGAESNFIVQFIAELTGWNEEVLNIVVRKAAHFTEYAVLGICLSVNMRDLMNSRTASVKPETKVAHITVKYMTAAWLIGTAYAATDEFHQLFVAGRFGSLTDVLIDSAGVACGVLFFLTYSRHRNHQV